MNESPGDVWFFSRDGHQSGPITFAELKEKADEGALRPRHDLAWTASMPEWKPVGEIDGLFERRVPTTTSVSQPLAAEPNAAAGEEGWPAHENAAEEAWPGTRRRGFLGAMFILPILWAVVVGFAKPLIESQLSKELSPNAITAIQFVPAVVLFWTSIQRLANLGMSRWWILGNLIPFLNIWIGYRSFACPAGYAYHKKLDGVGIFLAIIYWLVAAVVVAALVGIVLVLFGVIGDSDSLDKLKEVFEQLKTKAALPAK